MQRLVRGLDELVDHDGAQPFDCFGAASLAIRQRQECFP
jgi:hypothetical protein